MPKPALQPSGNFPPASLLRRFAAMFYDFLLCIALLMVVTLIYQQLFLRLLLGGEKLRQLADQGGLAGDPVLSSLLFLSLFAFFAKFWTYKGQTLGMQVWGVRVQNPDGTPITLVQALLRFIIAIPSWGCLGLGFLWSLWDKDKRTWHDRYSESVLVQIPKDVRKAAQGRG